MPRDAASEPHHQRAAGRLELVFGPDAPGRRSLRHLYQAAPLRALFPVPEAAEPILAALVNTAGGLAGGDAVETQVVLEPGAAALLTSGAAEKIYRSLGPDTRVATSVQLGEGATLEWLPQETILFDAARLRRRLTAHLAPGARLLAAEMVVLGRAARGERFTRGFVLDGWRLHGPEGLRWADALRLEPPLPALLAAPFGFAGADALATLLLAAPEAEAQLPLLRELAAGGGATIPRPGILLARWLGPAGDVRRALSAAIMALRAAALGRPARLPRLWHV